MCAVYRGARFQRHAPPYVGLPRQRVCSPRSSLNEGHHAPRSTFYLPQNALCSSTAGKDAMVREISGVESSQGLCRGLFPAEGAAAGLPHEDPPPPTHTWTPALQTKVTIVGKNEIYRWENLIGPFLVPELLGRRPAAPPHSSLLLLAWAGGGGGIVLGQLCSEVSVYAQKRARSSCVCASVTTLLII